MNFSLLKQNTLQRRELIINGSIPKTLLLLSLPTLMMGIVQSAIPLIDGLFINNVSGKIAASAVAYCVPVIGVIVGLSQGLSSAGMALIGQANGKGNLEEGRRISAQLVIFTSLLGVILAPALYAAAFPISAQVRPEISKPVFQYLALNTVVIPFSFLESIYNAIKNSNGKPEATFVRMVILLILKVIFNALFIAVLRWDITGAAMSSLASNLIITAWMYFELFIKKSADRLKLSGFRFDWSIIRKLVRVGLPAILANVMIYIGFFLINSEVEAYGTTIFNGQGIANNITTVAFAVPSSFAAAVTTMVSMNVGADNPVRARASCWMGCLLSAISAALLIALIVPSSPFLTALFTREPQVLEVANSSLHIYTYSVVGFGVCMVQLGAFIGLGRTWRTLIISVMRIWLLRYVFVLATEQFLSYNAVFWGNLFSNYTAALITTILVLRVKWVSVIKERDEQAEASIEAETLNS